MAKTKKGNGPTDEKEAQAQWDRDAAAREKADELAMLGRMTPTARAMFEFGLEERHVLACRAYPQPDGAIEVAILTQGGQRLRWPQDTGRVLSDMEKGDGQPVPVSAGIFSR